SAQGPAGISPIQDSDLPAIAELDREITGLCRLNLLRSLLTQAPHLAWKTDLFSYGFRGYVFGRPGAHAWQIGPIISESKYNPDFLFLKAAVTCSEQSAFIDVFDRHREFTEILRFMAFSEQRNLIRMY